MQHLATLEFWKAAARVLCLAAFAAVGWTGFGQPAAALIITDDSVTIEGSQDEGLMFDVYFGCDGMISGDGTQDDCDAATSTDLNGDGVDDLGGLWFTIESVDETGITFTVKIINSADDATWSSWGIDVIDPDATGVSVDDGGTLSWIAIEDTTFPGGMSVELCLTTNSPCAGGPVNGSLQESIWTRSS